MLDVNPLITKHLSLGDLPSLRACKIFYGIRFSLIKQQALYYGWDEKKEIDLKDPYKKQLEYLQSLFKAVRSINRQDTMCIELKMVFTAKTVDILHYLRNISPKEFNAAFRTILVSDQLLRPLLMYVISLSHLEGIVDPTNLHLTLYNATNFGECAEKVCRKLLEKGADPNSRKGMQENCVHNVIRKGNVSLTRLMIEFKGNPHLTNPISLKSTLQIAVEIGSREMLEYLLSIGVHDIPTQTGCAFSDAMNQCLVYPSDFKIELAKLLKNEAQTRCLDIDLNTYLHLAMRYDQQTWMLEDFDPTPLLEIPNRIGRTPLHEAVMLRKVAQIEYLIRWGANTQARDYSGTTVKDMTSPDLLYLFNRGNKREFPGD